MQQDADPIDRLRAALAGRYDIQRKLGEGGMALVFLAHDVRLDRTVAIKVLRGEVALAVGGERFLREVRLASRLQHPNILPVWDSGDAGGVLYFVMPYVTGESLRDRLDREKQLPMEDAVAITRQIADALAYAHADGIVHRDVKPENILLEQGQAIIADFGIARAASESGTKLTETGMSVGTPTYMSPEQALGGELDGRSDQYSLGCVLYELLTGQPPFGGSNMMAILAKHSLEPVPSVQVVRQSVPDDLEDVLLRSLEKTPADRFRSMKEFGDALAAVDLGPTARRTPAAGGVRRSGGVSRRTSGRIPAPVPRRRKPAIIAAAGVVLLLGGGAFAWSQLSAGKAIPEGPDPTRVAVMYFDTRGGDSLRFLADGLTEALIGELSQVEPLTVISRNGVAGFRDAPPDSAARALGVGTLVQGQVELSGDMLRLTVTMLDAEGVEIRGSRTTINRPRAEVFALQDTLATEVAAILRERLGQEVRLREGRAATRSAAAWEAFQRARDEARQVRLAIASGDTAAVRRQFSAADSVFAEAAALDPSWASPVTQRAWLGYERMRFLVSTGDRGFRDWLDRGLEHADRAVGLVGETPDADALEARGTLLYFRWLLGLEPDAKAAEALLDRAEADFRASIAANPGQASALTSLSHLLINRGRVAEAQIAATEAYERDPYLEAANTTLWRLFGTSLDLEDERNATRWCAEGGRRFPEDPRFTECQLQLFALKDYPADLPRAWQLLEEYVELSPPENRQFRRLRGQMLVAIALARAGLDDSARAVIGRSQVASAAEDPTRELAYFEAVAHTLMGDHEQALQLLAVIVATNPSQRRSFALDQTWWFRELRPDPRYRALVGNGS